ncbi:hypothetical protein C6A87_024755 [Mycobacterium sp. ITM-2016-00317]|uniref:hypothetical protein n=1 Tax=Mycobacterium sp. ITM-2016-00317 TaxID=2099694 RepID=UPI00287FD138|nr:hypothetical protein [Mycobacterium sp. ITM-2016-00317]WNG86967.1 hypothetical protein C6A87_024755 [Mycobacterium sp. ITM-2016-00317]
MAGATLVALVFLSMSLPVDGSVPGARASYQPFAPGSSFRAPVPVRAAVDPNSDAMVASASRTGGVAANLVDFGIPIYHADASTPRHTVECTVTSWGPCAFDGVEVPIPDGARPNRGSDGAMVVVDDTTRQTFEFWQARRAGEQWTTSTGAVGNLDGSGWGNGATASGASRLGGVIQVAEIQEGVISHALALQASNVCARVFRAPAITTDGHSLRSDCLPEGARLRLDPAVDLSALALTPGERTVARAMQVYGGYIVDQGGAALSMSFELDPTAGHGSIGSAYERASFRWDYDDMPGVPWDRLQVLA